MSVFSPSAISKAMLCSLSATVSVTFISFAVVGDDVDVSFVSVVAVADEEDVSLVSEAGAVEDELRVVLSHLWHAPSVQCPAYWSVMSLVFFCFDVLALFAFHVLLM